MSTPHKTLHFLKIQIYILVRKLIRITFIYFSSIPRIFIFLQTHYFLLGCYPLWHLYIEIHLKLWHNFMYKTIIFSLFSPYRATKEENYVYLEGAMIFSFYCPFFKREMCHQLIEKYKEWWKGLWPIIKIVLFTKKLVNKKRHMCRWIN